MAPPLRRVLFVCVALFLNGVVSAAQSIEDKQKAIRMKTTKQLKEILFGLDIQFDPAISKEALRDLVLEEDALSRYERNYGKVGGKQKVPSAGDSRKIFQTYDKDGNQQLDGSELETFFQLMAEKKGGDVAAAKAEMMPMLDENKNGVLERPEFLKFMDGMRQHSAREDKKKKAPDFGQTKSIFKGLDKDHNGLLEGREIEEFMGMMFGKKNLNPVQLETQQAAAMSSLDPDSSESVELGEFAAFTDRMAGRPAVVKRMAADGSMYTYEEFGEYYGPDKVDMAWRRATTRFEAGTPPNMGPPTKTSTRQATTPRSAPAESAGTGHESELDEVGRKFGKSEL